MTLAIKHKFHSTKPESVDATKVNPSNWNDEHEVTGTLAEVTALQDSMTHAQADILTEQSVRATADSAEATSRLTLSAQLRGSYTGDDITQLSYGLIKLEFDTRAAADSALAQQISLITAGVPGAFDPYKTWYFDTTVEGWIASGTSTVTWNNGWITVEATDITPGIKQTSDFNPVIVGTQYPVVKLRVTRNAGNGWAGIVQFKTAGHGFSSSYEKVLPDPGISIGDTTILEWDMSSLTAGTTDWIAHNILNVMIQLGDHADDSFDIDWIAVGRDAPGASEAGLLAEISARVTADSAIVSSITSLTTTVNNNASAISTETTARTTADTAISSSVTALTSRVTTAEGNITTNSSAITSEATTRATADTTEANARIALASRVTTAEGKITTAQAAITSEATTRATADTALATNITSLSSRVTTAETNITTLTASISTESTARANADSAEATLRVALAARMTTAEGNIASNTAGISTETTARVTADDALAAQISLIYAASPGAFDPFTTWYFDTDVEGWIAAGDSTLVWNAGWVTLAATGTSPGMILASDIAPGVLGSQYAIVKLRIKRNAGAGWHGDVQYTTGSHGFSASYHKAVADPVIAIGSDAVVEWDMSTLTAGGTDWVTNTITNLRIELGATAADSFDVDWIGVGRDAPGASYASVVKEAAARTSADNALASDTTTLAARVTTAENAISVNASAITTESTARATADSTEATARVALTSVVTGHTTSLATLSSGLTTESTTRASADTTMASQITTLQSTVTTQGTNIATNAAAITTEASTRASGDSANASTSTAISARLDSGDYAAVKTSATASASAITGILAKYSVNVDVNGHVVGFELINGSGLGDFVVTADKFKVVKPDGTGTPIQMMSLGIVGGVTTLSLNGNLVVDGSIKTQGIALNAVTLPVAAYSGSGVGLSTGVITTIQQVTVITDGSPILFIGGCSGSSDSGGIIQVSIWRGGSAVGYTRATTPPGDLASISIILTDQPAAGTYTYYLKALSQYCDGSVFFPSLVSMVLKR
jgi:hypothetical protein